MNTKAILTAIERAESALESDLHLLADELQEQYGIMLTDDQMMGLDERVHQTIRLAQDVVLTRLKTRAYEVRESYNNSGADHTIAADTWDAAVEAADPAEYDIMWMRAWER